MKWGDLHEMLINFTQKAIQELEIKKQLLDREAPEVSAESDEHTWYCNDLEVYSDASAILVVHKLTCFSFPIICKNPKGDQVEDLIRDSLLTTLMNYELPGPQIDRFMKASEVMHFVKGDNNRRLLGIMSSMKAKVQHMVDYARNKDRDENWYDIMLTVNSMPCGGPHHIFPEEEFVKRYGGKTLGRDNTNEWISEIMKNHED